MPKLMPTQMIPAIEAEASRNHLTEFLVELSGKNEEFSGFERGLVLLGSDAVNRRLVVTVNTIHLLS